MSPTALLLASVLAAAPAVAASADWDALAVAGVQAAEPAADAEALAGTEELISGATPQWRRFRALSDLLRGPEGQEVRLAIQPREGEPFSITLARSITRAPALAAPRPDEIAEVRPGILYIDLDRMTDDEFEAALPRFMAAPPAPPSSRMAGPSATPRPSSPSWSATGWARSSAAPPRARTAT